MPFKNSLLAGTALIRSAINSPNYVPGVSGWSINKDGSAEFFDVDIRGRLATGAAPDAYVELFDTESGYAQVVLSTNDPNQIAPGYVFATQHVGAGNALYVDSPDVGFGRARIKLLGQQDAVSRPQIEFSENGALDVLVKTFGDMLATGNIQASGILEADNYMTAPTAVIGDPNGFCLLLNSNQVYARYSPVGTPSGDVFINHASTGYVYLGQSGHIRIEPNGYIKTASGYLHLNWANSLPVAIGSSPTVVGRLGGAGGWQVDDTLTVLGFSTFAYPVAGTANASLTSGGLLQRIASSRRYKRDIEELQVPPEKILELIPRQFRFKHHFEAVRNEWDDNSEMLVAELPPEEAPLHIGFIAEEADELGLEEWVEYDENGLPDGFQYSNFIAAHQIVLRDQAKRIKTLETQLAELTKTVSELRGRVK